MRKIIGSLAVLASLSACTFVKMGPGAQQVRVASAQQDMTACERRGEVVVSVKNSLGPYERGELRVKDELETLARNEAPGLRADTVQPTTPVSDGEQRFAAFRCAGAAAAPPVSGRDSAQTVPLDD